MGSIILLVLILAQYGTVIASDTESKYTCNFTEVSLANSSLNRISSEKKQYPYQLISHSALLAIASVNESLRRLLSQKRKPPAVKLYDTRICTSFYTENMSCRYKSFKLFQWEGFEHLVTTSKLDNEFLVCGLGTGESGCASLRNLTSPCGTISYETSGAGDIRHCEWIIHVPDGHQVLLIFKYMNIRYCGSQCLCDHVAIYDLMYASEKQIFCGKTPEFTIMANSSSVRIEFNVSQTFPKKGFLLNYKLIQGTDLRTSPPVKLTTNNGTFKIPPASPNIIEKLHTIFEWHIRIEEIKRINFTWQLNGTCSHRNHMTVAIYEGPVKTSESLRTVPVNTSHGETMFSEGFQLFVRFVQPRLCKVQRFDAHYDGFCRTSVRDSEQLSYEKRFLESKGKYHTVTESTENASFPIFRLSQYETRNGSYIIINITGYQFNGPNIENCAYEGFLIWTGDDEGDKYGPFCGTHYATKFFNAKDKIKNSSPVIHSSTNTLKVFFYSYGLTEQTKLIYNVTVSQCIGLFDINRLNNMNKTEIFNYSRTGGKMIIHNFQEEICFQLQVLPSEMPCDRMITTCLPRYGPHYYITHHVARYSAIEGCTLEFFKKYSPDCNYEYKDYCKCAITAGGYLLGISSVIGNQTEVVMNDPYLVMGTAPWTVRLGGDWKNGMIVIREPLYFGENHHYVFTFKYLDCFTSNSSLSVEILERRRIGKITFSHSIFQVNPDTLLYQYRTSWNFLTYILIDGRGPSNYILECKLEPDKEPLPENCPNNSMIRFRNSCYKFYRNRGDSKNTWNDGQKKCKNRGGMLLVIDGESEMSFIKGMLKREWIVQNTSGDEEQMKQTIYIGLRVSDRGDRWIDGTPAVFTEWYRPLPSKTQIYTESLVGEGVSFASPLLIQPTNDPTSRCTAMVVVSPSMPTQWLCIPCQFPYPDSAFICEHRIGKGEKHRKQTYEIQGGADQMKSVVKVSNNLTSIILSRKKCPFGFTARESNCFKLVSSTEPINRSISCSAAKKLCTKDMGHMLVNTEVFQLNLLDTWLHRPEYSNVWIGECDLLIYNESAHTWELQGLKPVTTAETVLSVICETEPVNATLVCGKSQFRCKDGTCISEIQRCDGKQHCLDDEDEAGCECKGSSFRCADGQCISFSKYCDFVKDCKDNSDEKNCTYSICPSLYNRCDNGQCIESFKFEDYKVDCRDSSDEKGNHSYDSKCNAFRCFSGECLPRSLVQNMRPDCSGSLQEDESVAPDDVKRGVWQTCLKTPPFDVTKTNTSPYCPMGNGSFTRCRLDHVRCFERHHACVYDDDEYGYMASCPDGDHLRNCRSFECPDMYKCPDSYCIPFHKICNGKPDCPDGQDEGNCTNLSCPGLFKCSKEKICLDQSLVCDGIIHCKDSFDDEAACSYKKCPLGCLCTGRSVTCTNVNNDTTLDIPFDIRSLLIVPTENASVIDLQGDWFKNLIYLGQLHLKVLNIQSIKFGTFKNLHNLLTLDLRNNLLRSLQKGMFIGLNNLQHLHLSGNPLQSIGEDAFSGLVSIRYLHLENLQIDSVADECFRSLRKITVLSLNNNLVSNVSARTWKGLGSLRSLSLEGNDINQVPHDIFHNLKLEELHTDLYKLCCFAAPIQTCTPEGDAFSSCEDLMANSVLQVLIWILGVAAVVGNLAVIIARLITQGKQVTTILIVNLSVSDLLMGVYLLIIASADVTYRGKYIYFADDWRSGVMCKLAGFLSTLSSEMSIFMLVVLTADCLVGKVFKLSTGKLSFKAALAIVATGWVIFGVLSALPVLGLSYFGPNYIRNGVCLVLNITLGKSQGWEYCTFIFLLFNVFGILFSFASFVYIHCSMNDMANPDATDKEFELAQKFVLIVMTDFLCWVPLVCTSFASLLGFSISHTVSVWMSVIVLPINSALNPFLYTFSALRQIKEKWRKKRYRHR